MDKSDPLGEEMLIKIVQTGSRQDAEVAWEQLLLLHSSHLFAHLAFRGFVSAEQQDIASETWLRAWRKILQYKYDPQIGFFPWLRAISDFICMEHMRSQCRNPLGRADDEQRVVSRAVKRDEKCPACGVAGLGDSAGVSRYARVGLPDDLPRPV